VRGTSPSTDTVTSDLLAPRDSDRSALLFVGLRDDFRPCCCGQAVPLANQGRRAGLRRAEVWKPVAANVRGVAISECGHLC